MLNKNLSNVPPVIFVGKKKNVAFVRIKQFSDDCLTKLSDWLKDLALVFQPMRGKTKTNRTLYAQFFFPRLKHATGNCSEF